MSPWNNASELARTSGCRAMPCAQELAVPCCDGLDPDGHLHDWEDYDSRMTREREANQEPFSGTHPQQIRDPRIRFQERSPFLTIQPYGWHKNNSG
jgi:hypothetical protein